MPHIALFLILLTLPGVFCHVRTPRRHDSPAEVASLVATPGVMGSQLSYSWSELEPSEGTYRWDLVESDLAPWAAAGKTCWIEIETAAKATTGPDVAVTGFPEWIVTDHAVPVVATPEHRYPVFWNATYLALWSNFVTAFAARYDGDARIEFISTGGYSGGHEPNLSADDNAALDAQWTAAGFNGFIVGGVYLEQAIYPCIDLFAARFHSTPTAQTIHTSDAFDEAVIDHAAQRGLFLVNNGMSAKVNATIRQEWRTRREEKGVPTGYAEWGPAGRSPDGGPTEWKLLDVYNTVVGDDALLAPVSRFSYLPLGDWRPDLETHQEWLDAIAWATAHVEPLPTQPAAPSSSSSSSSKCGLLGIEVLLIFLLRRRP